MVRMGIVGVGFMGMIHFLAARRLRGAVVAAIQSRDPRKRAGDWRGIRGNFGPAGEQMNLAGISTYERLDQLLADPAIDLVDICLPTSLHAPAAIAALEAGKHVLVEKPLAVTLADADRMLAAAEKANRLLMAAHVLPFFPEFAFVADWVRSGKGGRLLAAHFERIICKPDWSADIADPAKTGGPAIDLHVHDTHFISLVCGVPRAVCSRGVVDAGTVVHLATQYLYDADPPCVTCASGAICQPGRPFRHGFEVYLEQATLLYRSGSEPLAVLHADGTTVHPALPGGDDPLAAFVLELQAAVDSIAAGLAHEFLRGVHARNALALCERECESVRTRQAVKV